MRGSWKLGDVAGIGIYVHWSFLVLPVIVGYSAFGSGGVAAAAESVLFILAVFACVALHELGHALAARRFGIDTQDITLLPIGGVARLDRMPRKPSQELVIALAGPAVNLVIAAAIFAGLSLGSSVRSMFAGGLWTSPFLAQLMVANVVLVVFNLLPAFPMDGGRVLRSVLAMRVSYLRATEIAAGIGQGMAILLGIVGLMGNGMLVLIALFVFLAARGEVQLARAHALAEQLRQRGFGPGMAGTPMPPGEVVVVEAIPD